jgi:nucleotide-binding universal stress UspA family protein
MSILLVGLAEDLMPPLIRRLTEQGDEVRVLEADETASDRWRSLGAHVASGPQWDADLIERAAQNVRTIVVGDRHDRDPVELMDAVIEGGGLASREMRLVVVGEPQPRALDALRASKLDFVVLGSAGRRGLLGRRPSLAPERLAEAVDAADDLAGGPRLELDLDDEQAWRELKLPLLDT